MCFRTGHVSMLSLYPDSGGRGTRSGYMLVAPIRAYIVIINIIMRAWYCHHSPNQVFAYPACNNGDCSENLPSVPCTPVLASYQFTGSHRVGYLPEELRGSVPALLGHSDSHSDSDQTLTLRHSDSHFETLSLLCSWLYIKA